jgi:serine/threonine protein kinase
MARSASTRRYSAPAPPPLTASPADYQLLEEVGHGANAVVYRAIFTPADRVLAVKCLDLDRVNSNLVSLSSRNSPTSLARFLPRVHCRLLLGLDALHAGDACWIVDLIIALLFLSL